MTEPSQSSCTVFAGPRRIASGELEAVALEAREALGRDRTLPILIFDDHTSRQIEVDFRGSAEDVRRRLADAAGKVDEAQAPPEMPRGPGRPKLGVVAREVTLLPRHWEWLNRQPGGASVALRRLVEEARRVHSDRDRVRAAQEAAYKFMSAMAGNEPGFEEAIRALFAGQGDKFGRMISAWPADVRDHARKLAGPALEAPVAK
jgi:hypothetical protein